jgi:hypothetical protein
MRVGSSLYALADETLPASFEGLKSHVDVKWIQSALARGGVGKLRNRKLSAEDIVWLIIGMSLYRDEPMVDVAHRLDLVLPDEKGRPGTVAKGAIPPARQRIGIDPLRKLFGTIAEHWALESAERTRWRGLMVLGADGSTLRVPDSLENRAEFLLPPASRSTSGYPQVRVAVLMVLRSHLWLDFDFADCRTGEGTVTWPLIQRVPTQSLTILDRYYIDHGQLCDLTARGEDRHWLLRARKNLKYRVVKRLGRGDDLVEVTVSHDRRRDRPDLPKTFLARVIRYQRKGFRANTLWTSLLDWKAYPSGEIIELYHERWELELGYDEIKTDVLRREETIRSKTPDGVRQELWGMAIAYNLVRREMDLLARELDLPPRRISFVGCLRRIRDLFFWAAITKTPGALPKRIGRMRMDLRRLILPERSSDRLYPRHVKIKMSGYKRNHSHPGSSTEKGLN